MRGSGDLTQDQLAGLQHVFDTRLGALLDDVFFIELNIAPVEHGVFRRADVDERRLHTWKHILHSTQIDVAVNLIGVVGGATDIVLDQASTFEHRHLREILANLHAHHVST